jgi:hypothetical protein
MTYVIINDFSHHPYIRMSQSIMQIWNVSTFWKSTLYATYGTSFMYVEYNQDGMEGILSRIL